MRITRKSCRPFAVCLLAAFLVVGIGDGWLSVCNLKNHGRCWFELRPVFFGHDF